MKNRIFLTALVLYLSFVELRAQSTSFTYQGRLSENGVAVSGVFDLHFTLYATVTNGAPVSQTITKKDPPLITHLTLRIWTHLRDRLKGPFGAIRRERTFSRSLCSEKKIEAGGLLLAYILKAAGRPNRQSGPPAAPET